METATRKPGIRPLELRSARRYRRWTTASLLVLALAAGGLDGATAQTASSSETSQMTETIESQALAVPPRSIDDITAILDQQKRDADPKAAKRAAFTEKQPPANAKPAKLARFHANRAKAALKEGKVAQAIEDYATADELSGDLPPKERAKIKRKRAQAEFFGGNRVDAIAHLREAIKTSPAKVAPVVWWITLAKWYEQTGNLTEAEAALAESDRALGRLRSATGRKAQKAWFEQGPKIELLLTHAQASLRDASGDYAEAEVLYRSALEKYLRGRDNEGKGFKVPPKVEELIRADLGRNLAGQHRLIEGEVQIRTALLSALQRNGRYSILVARLVSDLAHVMRTQGRPADAEALARAALDINEQIGTEDDSGSTIAARVQLAGALESLERWPEALAQYDVIRAATASIESQRDKLVDANPAYALALLQAGRSTEALPVAQRSVERLSTQLGEAHHGVAMARGVLGMALAAAGDLSAAYQAFALAAPILLRPDPQRDEAVNTGGSGQRRIVLEAYLDLLARIRAEARESALGIDAAAEAFRIAEATRGQAVQNALTANLARSTAGDPELAALARQEQDAAKQIGALTSIYADAVSVPSDQQDPKALEKLRARIDGLHAARAKLADEIGRRFPDYAALVNPEPATLDQARTALRPGESLIATYVGTKQSFIWALSHGGDRAFHAAELGRGRLSAAVDDLRKALSPNIATLGDIPAFDTNLAHRLFSALLAPVAEAWRDSPSLLVIAHGPLGQLPLSVLPTEPAAPPADADGENLFAGYRAVPWLARSHAVAVVPSVAALAALRNLRSAPGERREFLGFGDPVFDPSAQTATAGTSDAGSVDGAVTTRGLPVRLRAAPVMGGASSARLSDLPRLPDTAAEIKSMALALKADPTTDILLGARASESQLKSMDLSVYRVIAFSTHGLIPGDLDGLRQPALALSAPTSDDEDGDGLLTASEILALKLDADWVVLSACNTAAGGGAGAEAISGLGRAFFYAGARALLVSSWPVETTSARLLTTDALQRYAADPKAGRAVALQAAMLDLIDGPGYANTQGRVLFSYAHPIFWAPFTLVGDGGGVNSDS